MSGLSYEGPDPSQPKDVTDQDYINSLIAQNLTQQQIDDLITAGFAPYATRTYVTEQDTNNATKAYIDAGDATRVLNAQIDINSGVAGLDSSGLVDVARVDLPSTQRYPTAFWSPSAYNGSTVTATTETTVYTCTVTDPGYPYRIMATGQVDVFTNLDGQYPIIRVREDSPTTGTVIAMGFGSPESYSSNHSTAMILPALGMSPSIPPAFDAAGASAGLYGGKETSYSFDHTATAGAFVIVDVCILGGYSVSECWYGNRRMTTLAAVSLDHRSAAGNLYRFGISNVAAGTRTVYVGMSGNAYSLAESVSYTNVHAIGASRTVYGGDATQIEQGATCSLSQMIVQSFAADQCAPLWTPSGGTNRYNWGYSSTGNTRVADLLISDATADTNFTAASNWIGNWGGIITTLNGVAGSLEGPQGPRTGDTNLYVTLTRSGASSTVSATNVQPSLSLFTIPAG